MPSDSMSTTASKSARVELGVGRGAAAQREELVLVPVLGRAGRDDLLGEDVERRVAHGDAVDLAAAGRAHEGRALDELVAGEREEAALGRGDQRVARAADALERGGDRARRAEEAGEVHRAHVDAELERGGGHHHGELARLEPLLGGEAPLPAQAAVVRGDRVLRRGARARWRVTRSTRRRVLTKTSVERCARASSATRS